MKRIEPLKRFALAETNKAEKAEIILSQSLTDMRIMHIADQSTFNLKLNGVHFGHTSLLFNRYGSDTIIKSNQPVDAVIFTLGGNIPSSFHLNDKPVEVSSRNAVVVAPGQKVYVERPDKSEILVLRASFSELRHHLERLVNHHCRGTLEFERSIELTSGHGAKLKRLVDNLVFDLETNESLMDTPGIRKNINEMILTALLSLPHNHSEKLSEKNSLMVSPKTVRKVEEYMRAHLREPITITDLLLLCDCSRRSLFSAFKIFRGYTPMEFLTEQRLQSARQLLLGSTDEDLVITIAHACGFTHMGRFSQVYKRRFGELPSETFSSKS